MERAVTLYDGKSKRKNPDDSEILVCEECGSTNVEITAWVDANTNEYVSDSDDSEWCSECEAHNTLITLKEFKGTNAVLVGVVRVQGNGTDYGTSGM